MSIQQLTHFVGSLLERKENPYDGILAVASLWSRLLRHCQADLLRGVHEITQSALSAVLLADPEEQRQAVTSISETLLRLGTTLRLVYTTYRDSRNRLRSLARFWQVEDLPVLDLGIPAILSKLETPDLIDQLRESSDRWVGKMRELSEQGTTYVASYTDAARREDLTGEERAHLITQGLHWQNEVAKVAFAQTHGLLRRVAELIQREVKKPLPWEAPWEHDAEVGDRERI